MQRPLVLGEVLFDCFESGETLGGAPFNVAWHLRGFGLDPLFVSRIGVDRHGERVLEQMESWGLDASAMQRDPRHPTGKVQVSVHAGQPQFEILPDQAYDFLDWDSVDSLLEGTEIASLYHGTLAVRREEAARALLALRRRRRPPVFIDVNLRAPWWSRDGVRALVRGAHCVKLSDGELDELGEPEADENRPGGLADRAERLRGVLGIGMLVVTAGAGGACVVGPGVRERVPAAPVGEVVDTVGAGDAFSAVVVLGLTHGWAWACTLRRAAQFAALVCGYRGAVRADRTPYGQLLRQWRDDG